MGGYLVGVSNITWGRETLAGTGDRAAKVEGSRRAGMSQAEWDCETLDCDGAAKLEGSGTNRLDGGTWGQALALGG